MNILEYHEIFNFNDDGDYTLNIKFPKSSTSSIPDKKIFGHEISKLLDHNGDFITKINLDEHTVTLSKIVIDTSAKIITLQVEIFLEN